jgi:DNA-binding FadR family transcriptional regulator
MVPCLLVDGVMKLQGRVPTEEELSELLGVKKKD